jgi:ABC-2 type transport system ATP-binding protein
VEAMCERVIIINKGEIVANDLLSKLKTEGKTLENVFKEITMGGLQVGSS